MSKALDSRQSTLINAMRFPLIVLVLFAHSLGFETKGFESGKVSWNIYYFISEMISHNFAQICVCGFYLFSGYLFFSNLRDGEFGISWVANKWKKRVRSLVIPYIIWNLVPIIATVIKNLVFIWLGLGDDGGMAYVRQLDVAYWLWYGPANFPLYFMRDLILMSILAPLWYMLTKSFKWLSLFLLTICYLSPLSPHLIGMRAVFFFGAGAWMGICRVNMLQLCRSIKWPAAVFAVITLLVATYYNSSPYHEWLLRAFYPFGMTTFMNICDKLIDNENRCNRMCNLASAVFIIYATHEIYILGWTKGLFLRVFGDGLLGSWISYLFVPVVVLIICLCIYWLLNRFMPKTLAFVSGGRVDK